jgi:hypothetical protein
MAEPNNSASELPASARPDSGLADEVLLEETAGDDDGSVGLELDARQATEIRQIFLTTLPDYLAPVRQMVEQMMAAPDGDGELERALTKTLSSIAAAAKRVGIEDVHDRMETLREDVLLLSGSAEPEDGLRERISIALSTLDELAGGAPQSAAAPGRSETIVSAFGAIRGIDPSAPEKLMAAGVVHVEQLLRADPGEVAAVSGLAVAMVEKIVAALVERRLAPDPPAPDPPESERDPLYGLIEKQVENELALDEMRADALQLRLGVRRLREEFSRVDARRVCQREAIAEAKRAIAERLAVLTRVEERKASVERELQEVHQELERRALRVEALQAERRGVIDEHGRLEKEVAALSRRVDRVLRGPLSS